jgi:hypothetical protein
LSPITVANLFKEQNLALVVRQAPILKTHQRHQFGVFVNGISPSKKFASFFQVTEKSPEIGKVAIGSYTHFFSGVNWILRWPSNRPAGLKLQY